MKTKYVQVTNISLQFLFCSDHFRFLYQIPSFIFHKLFVSKCIFRVEKYIFLVWSANVCEPNSVKLSVPMRLSVRK